MRKPDRIQARTERLAPGNPGNVAPVSEGVSELRIDVGPGYRVYFTRRAVIILHRGGSTLTQAADIKAALQLARGQAPTSNPAAIVMPAEG